MLQLDLDQTYTTESGRTLTVDQFIESYDKHTLNPCYGTWVRGLHVSATDDDQLAITGQCCPLTSMVVAHDTATVYPILEALDRVGEEENWERFMKLITEATGLTRQELDAFWNAFDNNFTLPDSDDPSYPLQLFARTLRLAVAAQYPEFVPFPIYVKEAPGT